MSIDQLSRMIADDRQAAAAWACALLATTDWCVLDTETTGLGYDDEAVHVAVVAPDGPVLFDSLVKPSRPIPESATDIHGITDAKVADAPSWQGVAPLLVAAIGSRRVVAYNAQYDERIISQSAYAVGDSAPQFGRWECAMLRFAEWYGDYSTWHGSYRWQRLEAVSGAHTAIGDCRSTLAVLKKMADSCK